MSWTERDLLTVGYFPRRVEFAREALPEAPQVEFVCSVSSCLTQAPAGWVDRWLHNELGFYASAAQARSVVPRGAAGFYVLGARVLPVLFDDAAAAFSVPVGEVEPLPESFTRLGYEACARYATFLDCSPLSCNGLAAQVATNRYCLVDRFADGLQLAVALGRGEVSAEPGPYLLVETWIERVPS